MSGLSDVVEEGARGGGVSAARVADDEVETEMDGALVGVSGSAVEVEVLREVLAEGLVGGLEGVVVAEGVGVDIGFGAEAWTFSLSSPYSFHSSTSSRSYTFYKYPGRDTSFLPVDKHSPRQSSQTSPSQAISSFRPSDPITSLLSHL